uniref:Uncharacterized protein n=1 Tax=Panagrolaimus sp. ES5 TaxID=591445 RepID=A0AC34GTU3_9BILA
MPLAIDIAFKWGGKKPPEEEKKDPSTSESTRPSDSTKTDETTNSMSSDRQPESTQADSASSTAEKKKQQKNKETQKTVSTSEKQNSESDKNSKESTKSTETETLTTEDDEVSKKSEAKKKELNENAKLDSTINLVEKLLIQRRVIIFRHGERMDRVFPSWIRQSNSNGSFRPYNSNHPKILPKRRGGLSGYDGDPPITEIGKITAQLSAKSLKQSHQKISAIYSSPAFRCIETAQILAKESGNSDLKIKIEYGLFDCCNFYEMAPTFFTTTELLDAGFSVAKNYRSIISKETFYNNFGNETKHDFYRRSHDIIHK